MVGVTPVGDEMKLFSRDAAFAEAVNETLAETYDGKGFAACVFFEGTRQADGGFVFQDAGGKSRVGGQVRELDDERRAFEKAENVSGQGQRGRRTGTKNEIALPGEKRGEERGKSEGKVVGKALEEVAGLKRNEVRNAPNFDAVEDFPAIERAPVAFPNFPLRIVREGGDDGNAMAERREVLAEAGGERRDRSFFWGVIDAEDKDAHS